VLRKISLRGGMLVRKISREGPYLVRTDTLAGSFLGDSCAYFERATMSFDREADAASIGHSLRKCCTTDITRDCSICLSRLSRSSDSQPKPPRPRP